MPQQTYLFKFKHAVFLFTLHFKASESENMGNNSSSVSQLAKGKASSVPSEIYLKKIQRRLLPFRIQDIVESESLVVWSFCG